MKKYLAAIMFCFVAKISLAQSNDDKKLKKEIVLGRSNASDVALGLGAAFGSYNSKDLTNKDFGGILVTGRWLNDQFFDLGTSYLGASILIDFQNKQIVRKSIQLGENIYLLGGKKREVDRLKMALIASSSKHSLSLPIRFSQDFYSAVSTKVGSKELSGSSFNISTGLSYQWAPNSMKSLGLELLSSVLSLANSTEKATEKSLEFNLFYRFDI